MSYYLVLKQQGNVMTFYAENEGKKLIMLAQRSLITLIAFDYCFVTEMIETIEIKTCLVEET